MFPIAAILPMATQVDAWGLATHMFIVDKATEHLSNETWAEAFNYYSPELLGGSTTPDQAWQDWDNHLYYPETGEHNAPSAASRWYNYARNNFTAAAAAEGPEAMNYWEVGFFSAGVMSHYASDPCIPVHTDDIEDEIPELAWPGHSAYEGEINSELNTFTLSTPSETIISNVSDLVVSNAVYSHQYFDLIADAYPTGTSTALSNASVRTATENCLSLAIDSILSLFYTLTIGIDAPNVTITYDYKALFDYAHSNDYSDGGLTSVNQTLARNHFEMLTQEDAFSTEDLTDVELLIITCGLDSFSAAELSAISTWASSGEKGLIVTGRGDFSEITDIATANQVLQSIGSNIRINDDNVYMEGTYQPWYNDLVDIPAPENTVGLTEYVLSLTLYSPTSLYFIDEGPALPIIFADESGYQTDQTSPTIDVVYDNSIDGENGNQIPLVAVEEVGDLRLLVAGTTFFSDFDYGKTQFDNVELFDNFLKWTLGDHSEDVVPDWDEMGPKIGDITFTPSNPDSETDVTLSVIVTDASTVDNVTVKYRIDDVISIIFLDEGTGDAYTASIPGQPEGTLSLTIEAIDSLNNTAIRTPIELTWGNPSTTTEMTTESTTTPTEPAPQDMTLLIIGVVAVIGVILVVVIIMKRR